MRWSQATFTLLASVFVFGRVDSYLFSSSCPLVDWYYTNRISDAYGRSSKAQIHGDFVPYLHDMQGYAEECHVKVRVTSHYRDSAVTGNAWNAQRSCHMIGHAIDMNLQTDSGVYCNSRCLTGYRNYDGPNADINCFLEKILQHSTLHWGITFNDPVHIDDRTCARDPSYWDSERQKIINHC